MRLVAASWVFVLCASTIAFAAVDDGATVRLRIEPVGVPARTVDVPLAPSARRTAALASLRNTALWRSGAALPRAGASSGDRSSALQAARDALPRYGSPPLPRDDLAPQARGFRYGAYVAGHDAIHRIFAVAGEPSDAQRLLDYCRCTTFEEKLDAVATAAYLENRLGTLQSGSVEALTRSADPAWRAAGAMALHEYGNDAADANILAFIDDPRNLANAALAAPSLYDSADPKVLPSMRALLARATDPETRGAAAAYLLAYGSAGDRRRVESTGIGVNGAVAAAYLTDEPARIASALAGAGVWPVARILPALRAIPPARIPTQYNGVARAADATYAAFSGIQTFAIPSKALASLFLADKFALSDTPWIPWINGADAQAQLVSAVIAGNALPHALTQFDYLTLDEMRALFTAKGNDAFAPADLLYAAHRVATRAYTADLDPYHDGIERRAYAVRASSNGYSGLVEMHPSLGNGRLHVALHFLGRGAADCGFLAQLCENDADNAYYKYMTNGGQALVETIVLNDGKSDVAAAYAGRTPTGWLLYEAPFTARNLTGAYLNLTLKFIDQRIPLVFDLFDSDYARTRTVLARRATAHDALAARANSAAGWVEAARYYRAMDDLDAAWPRYQKALALAADPAPLWAEAAAMYAGAHDYDGAIGVLREQIRRDPSNAGAWRDLAAQLYAARRYPESAAAAARALAADPNDANVELLQAIALYLGGDRRDAAQILAARADNGTARVAPLWYVSERATRSERSAAASEALAALRGQPGSIAAAVPYLVDDDRDSAAAQLSKLADLCRAQAYLGYHYLFAGDHARASEHFRAALATLQVDQLEYRLAQTELATLAGERRGLPLWSVALFAVLIAALLALGLAVVRRRRSA